MATLVAVTMPLESALPCADAHLPTFTALAVADFSLLISVVELMITVLFVVLGLLVPEPNSRAATTSVLPDTDTTVPRAMAPGAARFPASPVEAPGGRVAPERVPDGRGLPARN